MEIFRLKHTVGYTCNLCFCSQAIETPFLASHSISKGLGKRIHFSPLYLSVFFLFRLYAFTKLSWDQKGINVNYCMHVTGKR